MSDIGSGWFGRKRETARAQPNSNGKKRSRRGGIIALEPRMMYDGAGHATLGAAAGHHFHHDVTDHNQMASAEKHLEQMPNVQTAAPTPSSANPSTSTPSGNTPPGNTGGNTHSEDASRGNGLHQSGEPMPHVATWVKDPTEIVFIDPQAPDYQMLAAGVKPGIEVVVLDPNSDGVQQIANFLARHPDPNLTTIDIVAHGQDGMLFLGNAVLDNDTVGQYAAQLKTIGAAMQPGGDLMLYGCDVAADPTGVVLLAQIADETGVKVAAATGDVGGAAEGGTWALNATTGAIDAAVPFTAQTIAAYSDLLNADLFVSSGNGATTSILTDRNGTVTTASAGSINGGQIVLDTADNLYFVLDTAGGDSVVQIQEGTISNALAGVGQLFTIYSDSTQISGVSTAADQIAGMQIDTANHLIYFVTNRNINAGVSDTSVFEKISYSTTALTVNINETPTVLATLYNEKAPLVGSDNTDDNGGVGSFAMDFTNPNAALAVFGVEYGGDYGNPYSIAATNELYEISNITPTATTLTPTSLPINIPVAEGTFTRSGGMAIADNNGAPILYFTLTDGLTFDSQGNSSFSSTSDGLYSYNLTSGAFTAIFQNNASGPSYPALEGLTIDTITGKYYGVDGGIGQAGVYVGSLTLNAPPTTWEAQPTRIADFTTAEINESSGTPSPAGVIADDVSVTVSGSSVNDTAGGSAVTVDRPGSGISITDTDGTVLTGATVSIGSFQANDVLGIAAADLTGTNITEGYNTTTGVLTLTGNDTEAHYAQALSEITFGTTSTTGGLRTVNFTVTDGFATSASVSDTVNVLETPTLKATGANQNFFESLTTPTAVTLFSGATATVPAGDAITELRLTVSGLSAGDNEQLIVDGKAVSLTNGNVVPTGTSNDQVSVNVTGGVATVTITDPGTNFTTATAQTLVNGLQYEDASSPLTTGTRTITLTSIYDNDTHGAPTSATASGTSTVTVNAINHPPSLTANADNPSFSEGGSAVVLFGSAAASTNDSGQGIEQLQLKVSNLADGANEKLEIDGSLVSLTNGTTTIGSDVINVTLAGTTATVTITNTSNGNLTTTAADTLIDGLAYEDTSATLTAGTRTVTLTDVQDNGGTANGGKDTTTLAIASVVTLTSGPVIAPASKNETGSVTEIAGVTGSSTPDTAGGTINFTDTVLADVNTSSASFVTAVSSGNAIPAGTLTALGSALTTVLAESNGSGTVNWTFSLADSNLDFLGADQTLTATYHVTISNGNGGTDTATVTITATGTNDAAIISGATTGDVTEAGGVNNAMPGTPTASGTLTDTDVDNPANTFTAVTTATPSDHFGSFTMTSGGTWTYTLDNSNATVQALNVGQTLTDTFTVATVDGTGQQITITIHGANDAAIISGATTGDVTEAGGVNNAMPGTPTASGTLTDTDVDNPANTFTAVTTATPSDHFGSFTMTSGGTWTYTLDNSNATVQALNVEQTLTDTFTVATIDGTGQQITITIYGANDAAIISGATTGDVTEAGGVNNAIPGTPTASGTLTDTDVDNPANTFTAVTTATPSDHFGSFTMTSGGTWTYTLDNSNATVQALNVGQTLTDTFTVATVDGTGQQITITIHGANDAAIISGATTGDVTEAGGVNNAMPGTPTASGTLTDTDVDNPANTFTAVTTATPSDHFGSFTMTSGGTWTYTLDNSNATVQALNVEQTLTDTFTVATVDGTGQQITITIHGANDAAIISGATTGDVTEAGGVNNAIPGTPTASGTLTDTDVDNPANTFTAVTTATPSDHFGSFTMTSGGTWTYTLDNSNATVQALNVGQTLTDTFTVATVDGTGQQITITIHGANDAAIISGATTGDVTEAGGVNNAMPGTPTASGTLTDTDVDNPANTFTAVTTATPSDHFGSFTMTSGGTWTYTLDNSNATVQALNVGQTLTDTFTVATVDGTGQQITITIHGANDAAIISGATTGDVTEAGGVSNAMPGTPTASGTLTDTDVDNPANTFTAVTTATPSDHFGSFTMTSGGTWTYTLDNSNATVQALNVGQTLTDTFTVATVDGTGQQITITIHGANDAAIISGATTGDVTEAGGVNNAMPGTPTASGTLTDTDVDNPANTFTAVTTATPSDHFGSFTMTSGGTWTYTLDNSNATVQALNVGQTLTDTFTVATVDGTGQQITITIHGANDAAIISGATTGDVTEAGGVNNAMPGTPTASGTLTDTDVDNPANTFTAVTTATPSDHFGSFTMTSGGTWTYTLDNSNATVQALNVGQTLTDTFTVATVDGTGQQITITIHGANDAAIISGATTGDVTEAGGVNNAMPGTPTASGTLTDTDVDNPANTFTAVTTATPSDHFGSFTMTSGGTWTYTLDNSNATVQALNVGQTLTDTFTVATVDGTGQQITITIHGANDAAVVGGTDTGTVVEAGGVNNNIPGTPTTSGTLTDTDVDNPANTFTAVSASTPSDHGYGGFTMTANGTWTYTLDNSNAKVQALNVGQTLTDTFTVATIDGTTHQVTITIDGANDAAVVSGITTGTVIEAGGVNNALPGTPTTSCTLTDTDVDNPANTFTALTSSTPSDHFGSFTMTAGGTWSYTLDNSNAQVQALNVGQTLTDTFTVHTVDGTAQQITVTIDGANDTPVVTAGNTVNFDANAGRAAVIDPTIAVSDVDNATLAGAQVSITGGFDAGHDSLGFANQNGISGSFNSSTGVLTLSGTASVADYQAALASVTLNSISAVNGVRTVQWTVDDGSALSHRSLPTTTLVTEQGVFAPPHPEGPPTLNYVNPNTTPGATSFDNGPTFQVASFTPEGPAGNGGGFSFNVVHSEPVLTTASDANVQINLTLAALEAPLGGDVVAIEARQADGKPLPDWLKFDPVTGSFVGLPPGDAVASLAPDISSDNAIVTGSLRQNFDGAAPHEPDSGSVTIEVLARDSHGNVAVTVFTIDLHKNGKHGWNLAPFGNARHAALSPPLSPELAAIEAAVHDATRTTEPFGSHGLPVHHGEAISIGASEALAAGRAGLTQQMAQVGWRSMAAQRNALLASLRQGG